MKNKYPLTPAYNNPNGVKCIHAYIWVNGYSVSLVILSTNFSIAAIIANQTTAAGFNLKNFTFVSYFVADTQRHFQHWFLLNIKENESSCLHTNIHICMYVCVGVQRSYHVKWNFFLVGVYCIWWHCQHIFSVVADFYLHEPPPLPIK